MSNTVELIMSTDGESFERQNVPFGTHQAAISSIIDFGEQDTDWGIKKQIELTFEFPEHIGTFKDGEQLPLFIAKRYTLSLHPKSALAKDLVMMRGAALPAEFNIYSMLGANVLASVIHIPKDGVTYANVNGFAPIKDVALGVDLYQPAKLTSYLIGMQGGIDILASLPEWKEQRIRAAKNFTDIPF